MVNENLIPKTETVYEIKDEYKIPTFEEFMKTYKGNENLNYDDLNSYNIGEVKGYGPCTSDYCSCSNYELRQQLKQAKWRTRQFWEKFKEYDGKWEKYRGFVEWEERKREENEKTEKWVGFATELIPIPFLGSAITSSLTTPPTAGFWVGGEHDKESIYKAICDKYSELWNLYQTIKNKF